MTSDQTVGAIVSAFRALGATSPLLPEEVEKAIGRVVRTSLDKYKLFAFPQGEIWDTDLAVGAFQDEDGSFVAQVSVKESSNPLVTIPLATIRYAE